MGLDADWGEKASIDVLTTSDLTDEELHDGRVCSAYEETSLQA